MYQTLTASTLLIFFLAGSAAAQEKLSLNLRFDKGTVRHVTTTSEQKIDRTDRDARRQTQQTVTVGYAIGIDHVDARGAATVSVKYETVTFKTNGPDGNILYDSSSPPGQVPAEVSGLAALVGNGYTAKLEPEGKVSQISGAKALLDRVLGQLNLPDATARSAAEKLVRQELNESSLKRGLENLFAPLPDHPVALGDIWKHSAHTTAGLSITIDSTYTLKSRQDGVATLSVAANLNTTKDSAIPVTPLTLTYEFHGTQTGSLDIDESTGWIKRSDLSQTLTGSVTIRGPNTDPQSVPVTIATMVKTTVK
ncbi:MAG TPA: DUF6263 family protein [Tepidisphaeraceae bacterium]|nr:DUF6263 family protein [Tepidisphaeraceae bacterium]